jgi:serine/threonine-protein kinase
VPVDPDLEVGDKVGEYEVSGKLGQGAFGTVFQAVHPLIGKEVAIKVLARRFSVDPEMVSRFIAEARAVNQIRHRHIIDIFAFGSLDDGRQYFLTHPLVFACSAHVLAGVDFRGFRKVA